MTRAKMLRGIAVLLVPMLLPLLARPDTVSAQTNLTYQLTKTFSPAFTCGGSVPSGYTATGTAAPGQCVAVQIAITNTSTTTTGANTTINNLVLSDALPAALTGLASSCFPAASGGATCTVTGTAFSYNSNGGSFSLAAGQTFTQGFITQVSPAAACGSVIPNTAGATVSGPGGAFTGNTAAASLTVQCAAAPQTFALAKTFLNCVSGAVITTAVPGQCVVVQLAVRNNASSTLPITGVRFGDTLPASLVGQTGTCSSTSPACVVMGNSFTFNATANIMPGQVGVVQFEAVVAPTAACGSKITNTAMAVVTNGTTTFTQTDAGLATSSLVVTCTTPTPTPTTGNLVVCGIVSGYNAPTGATAGSLVIGGLTIPIAAGAVVTANFSNPFLTGNNICVTLNFVNGVATVVSATPNVPTVAYVCGSYAVSSTSGYIGVGGYWVPVASGSYFMVNLTVSVTYCFLLSNGQVYAVLSGVPTSVKLGQKGGYAYREGFTRAE